MTKLGRHWLAMGGADNGPEVLSTATNAMIRLLSVKSPQTAQPVADIANKEGLPASPFRTDTW
jgi:hypothetical protein